MTFQNYTNFFNVFSASRHPNDRKAPGDMVREEERKAKSAMISKFRADLCHHLGSGQIQPTVAKRG